ncbi:FmdB family transcriptional regulator [Rhodococcoides fascians A21d2]|uniref:FmdB family zinc ribbon protein n=1 Tax=Nocardiaceae TaxID=85025 RepID=UPI00050C7C13|nr:MULTISPECIES: FmdB family zinc ribbon protein [Rhodococcus]KQU46717.1 FmdB family transcriptional regulator [Rhodococcus sp. Leaf278]OZC52561.1 FmdB family transcriptional regulator [Rhodococcus sp. WWJCD1]OZE87943.1 FmdB family transcriptional regulator [Rhodococcus sp. 15-649-2-2]QII00162.1 FmdB family transcriptional regulator [Rhodococcus fascians A21d2]QII07465.1 FmdB family transcriptional regulator [Rhodococcus fascians A25f]
MPTYSYACTECDNRFDIVQSFTDDTLTVCPACSGKLRKLFNSVGIVFKGSGFYRTDSRGGSSTSSEGAGEKKSDAAAAKSDSKSESKSDSKPAEKKSSDSSSSSSSSSSSTTKAAASQ